VVDAMIHKIDGYNLSNNKIVQLIPDLLAGLISTIPGLGAASPGVRLGTQELLNYMKDPKFKRKTK